MAKQKGKSGKTHIKFEMISLADVPSREVSTKVSGSRRGSQWEKALTAIEDGRGQKAIKIIEADGRKRNWLKSTLQTMARKRGMFVEVRDDGNCVYTWASERGGRFSPPTN